MVKTIIVDDEPSAIKVLKLLIEQHCPELQIISCSDNINEAYQEIITRLPDLLFLDINMPKGNGLELLERVQHLPIETILTTAHQQFAVEALRLSALDYILKPIGKEELRSAVDRFNNRRNIPKQTIGNFNNQNPRITIKTMNGLSVLNLKDIQFVQSHKNYSVFHNGIEEIVSSKPLSEYEKLLAGFGFIRLHRSNIVQVSHIKELKRGRNWTVTLLSNHILDVARNKQDEVVAALNVL